MNELNEMSAKRIGERLALIRLALGYETQRDFAAAFNFTSTAWNNFEKGFSFSHHNALRLVQQVPGLSLDYIYRGDKMGLSQILAQRIGELEQSPARNRKNGTA